MIPTVLDQFETPPCAQLLGLDILEADAVAGTVRIQFEARPEFCNASGAIQGGFLAAMLDDCMGPAVLIAMNAEVFPITIGLQITFLARAEPGSLFARASFRRLGRTIGYAEAILEDGVGREVARGVSTVRLVAMGMALRQPAGHGASSP